MGENWIFNGGGFILQSRGVGLHCGHLVKPVDVSNQPVWVGCQRGFVHVCDWVCMGAFSWLALPNQRRRCVCKWLTLPFDVRKLAQIGNQVRLAWTRASPHRDPDSNWPLLSSAVHSSLSSSLTEAILTWPWQVLLAKPITVSITLYVSLLLLLFRSFLSPLLAFAPLPSPPYFITTITTIPTTTEALGLVGALSGRRALRCFAFLLYRQSISALHLSSLN